MYHITTLIFVRLLGIIDIISIIIHHNSNVYFFNKLRGSLLHKDTNVLVDVDIVLSFLIITINFIVNTMND
jgi:hypothetical protein